MKAQRFVTFALLVTLFTLAWGRDQTATARVHAGPAPMTGSEIDFTVPKSKPTTPTADPFTDIGATLTAISQGSVAWGDYDNDGNLDILMTGYNTSWDPVVKIYRNLGGGVFTDTDTALTAVDNGSAAWGD